ncbi:MAG: aminotransferase class I/II-fold pyridoxal phosphate-dependent enzyme [Phycisphaerales bacterium]|jgi:histidinol-phosphate aminotransferase
MSTATNEIELRPAARLEGLRPYSTGTVRAEGALLLDANEGPGAPDAWLERLRSVDAEALRRYPKAAALEAAIAGRLGVDPARVVVTAGGDDAIDRVCRVALEPGRSIVVHTPTFEMITRGARLAGGQVRSVPWLGGPFPGEAFESAISPETGLVAIVSPNNPTGGVVGIEGVERVCRAARAVGALVLVDLAYVEYADEDPTSRLLEFENAVIVRTFSKAYGLAGLRVGYAITSERVAGWLRTVGGPYPVSAPGLAIAGLAWEAGPEAAYLERVRRERERLRSWLVDNGIEVLDSRANFVLARIDSEGLAARGVVVRAFGGELAGWSRITLPGDDASFARLMDALGEVCDG